MPIATAITIAEIVHAARVARTGLDTVKKGAALAKRVDPAERLKNRFQQATDETFRAMNVISYAVVRAVVAHALGTAFDDDDVDAVFEKAATDPTFGSRMYRLIGEGLKTSAARRRRFLAAMLYGLQFSSMPEDERDRVDMVVERMTPDDAELLLKISQRAAAAVRDATNALNNGLFVKQSERGLALTTWDRTAYPGMDIDQPASAFVDEVSFQTLVSLGCLQLRGTTNTTVQHVLPGLEVVSGVQITGVGQMVLGALDDEAVKVGLDANIG